MGQRDPVGPLAKRENQRSLRPTRRAREAGIELASRPQWSRSRRATREAGDQRSLRPTRRAREAGIKDRFAASMVRDPVGPLAKRGSKIVRGLDGHRSCWATREAGIKDRFAASMVTDPVGPLAKREIEDRFARRVGLAKREDQRSLRGLNGH